MGFICNGFSSKLVKIAQDSEVRNLLTTSSQMDNLQRATWGAHAGSWRVKCQRWISRVTRDLANSRVTREILYLDDFKCDYYTLHPYYIYPHYPQNCKESIQKKTLESFLQHIYLVKESYTSLSENSFIVSFPSPLPLLYLERRFVPKHNSHLFRV